MRDDDGSDHHGRGGVERDYQLLNVFWMVSQNHKIPKGRKEQLEEL